MKNIYAIKKTIARAILLIAVAAVMAVTFYACKRSPTDGVSLVVNANIIKYSALVQIGDVNNNTVVPANVKMTISGKDGDNVYEITGKKVFTLHNGEINVGLNPALVPTASNPSIFTLQISADGYMPVSQTIKIKAGQNFQRVNVKMLNLNSPPAGTYIIQQDVDATTGSLVNDEAVKIGTGQMQGVSQPRFRVTSTGPGNKYYDDALTTIILPKGTTFYYYKNVKTGTVTGKDSVPIYGDPISIGPNIPVNVSGLGNVSVSGLNVTYQPIVSYYYYEYTRDTYDYVKTRYMGKVKVVCIYSHGVSKESSVFPYGYYNSHNIGLLNKTTAAEDEMLFTSAVKQHLDSWSFIGTVGGNQITISPTQVTPSSNITSSYNSPTFYPNPTAAELAITWRTSYVLDPDVINPLTGQKIQPGDSIETGINYQTLKTTRSAIFATPSGQLRAESQSPDMGYYYQAPYKQTYAYTFNITGDTRIPDPENLSAYYTIDCGSAGNYVNYVSAAYSSAYPVINENGKIISKTPITASASYASNYFDQRITGVIPNGGSANLFTGWTALKPLVTLNLSLKCTGDPDKPVTVNPSYNAYYGSENGAFALNILNGVWSTRGLNIGQTISSTTYLSTASITFSWLVKSGVNPLLVTFGYKDNQLCRTF